MITRVQSNNNKVNFGALKLKPIELGKNAQTALGKINDFSSIHQRLAIGTFGLVIQPMIDIHNKEVDEETRKTSAVRSAAKAIIGTATGIVVRGACMKASELKFAKRDALGKIVKENGKLVLDEQKIKNTFKEGFEHLNLDEKTLSDSVKRVPSVIGTIAALGVMIITNFVVDAPLTNITMEKINKFMEEHFARKKQSKGGANE